MGDRESDSQEQYEQEVQNDPPKKHKEGRSARSEAGLHDSQILLQRERALHQRADLQAVNDIFDA